MTAKVRIAFDNVSVRFPTTGGSMQVVDDVSYRVHDREFVSVIGPSGCGKTTMMNIVAGFMQPSSGTVMLDGKPIAGPGPDRGVIFQEYGIFPWLTVKENIAFGLNLRANRVGAAEREEICQRYMRLMGLADFAGAWPRMLSGGMRQRLALARAYAVKPQFLLMDEPFGALDAQTRSAMQDLLLHVLAEEGKTVMLITHSVEEAVYLSNRIIVMTARPTRIREIIEVPFAYPRTDALHKTAEFGELRAHVRDLVMQEYAQQARQRSTAST
ncbi:MAG: ABC transporter ATP-binding protein [Hyphomonadaceae bacterium]|jgi:NitT/TauT family transport system ATP-binding protein|nr:ABC transporter ATP-binding protein [Hyphomonadaceae bacterium]